MMGRLANAEPDHSPRLADDYYRQLRACEHALRELVALKDEKDRDGKTFNYLQNQPLAWAKARAALDRSVWKKAPVIRQTKGQEVSHE